MTVQGWCADGLQKGMRKKTTSSPIQVKSLTDSQTSLSELAAAETLHSTSSPALSREARRPVKRRRRLSPQETTFLIEVFDYCPKPSAALRDQISTRLGMSQRNVQIWFQNRRAKVKRDTQENEETRLFFADSTSGSATSHNRGVSSLLGKSASSNTTSMQASQGCRTPDPFDTSPIMVETCKTNNPPIGISQSYRCISNPSIVAEHSPSITFDQDGRADFVMQRLHHGSPGPSATARSFVGNPASYSIPRTAPQHPNALGIYNMSAQGSSMSQKDWQPGMRTPILDNILGIELVLPTVDFYSQILPGSIAATTPYQSSWYDQTPASKLFRGTNPRNWLGHLVSENPPLLHEQTPLPTMPDVEAKIASLTESEIDRAFELFSELPLQDAPPGALATVKSLPNDLCQANVEFDCDAFNAFAQDNIVF